MKKFSQVYFDKKFKALFNKLIVKSIFIEEIQKVRQKLKIPTEGFRHLDQLAEYLVNRLSKNEQEQINFIAFMKKYEVINKKFIQKTDKEKVFKEFIKDYKKKNVTPNIKELFKDIIEDHLNLFTKTDIIRIGKKNSKIFAECKRIFNAVYSLEMLDSYIIMHFIEKYLFLGNTGIEMYTKKRTSCSSCRYIGLDHFSPDRNNMQGHKYGPFDSKYIFNKNTIKMLSKHFNSTFIIIKPYATKEEVINYIDENWSHIKEHIIEKNPVYKQFDVHLGKIKDSNVDKNRLVYSLYRLSKKELSKIYTEENISANVPTYKESIISAILKIKYDIEMSAQAVKKCATRFAKSTEINREPKDIRDI